MLARISMARILGGAAALSLVACGPDDGQLGPDGGPGGDDAGVGVDGLYGSPDDFDRTRCGGGVGNIELEGIWHMAIDFDAGSSVVEGGLAHEDTGANVVEDVVRIDRGDGGALEALLFGIPVDDVILTSSDLLLRRVDVASNGSELVRAWNACSLLSDGSLFGRYANCRDDNCLIGTFEAHRLEPLDEPSASGISEVASFGGSSGAPWPVDSNEGLITVNVRQEGEVAYVVRYYDGLRIVDVSDPQNPVELGHAPTDEESGEFFNDVKIVRGDGDSVYAIAASSRRGAVVFDVTDPSSPSEVVAFPEPEAGASGVDVHTLFIEGSVAYLANLSKGGLDIYDVSNPASPAALGSYVDDGVTGGNDFVHDLFVEDGVAYLNYWNLGLVVVDVSDPAAPERLGSFDDYAPRASHSNWVTEAGGRLVSVHGDEGYDAHVRIIDVDPSSPGFMQAIGTYQTRPHVSVHNIMAAGDLAYVTYYQDGLRVLDLSDPSSPQELAHYHTWPGAEPDYGYMFFEGAIGVDLDDARQLIYVADTHQGLLILSLD